MQHLVADILSAWRRAERLAQELEQGDPSQIRAAEAAARLQEIYLDLTAEDAAEEAGGPVPVLQGDESPA
jgi:hypothetical protein